jgi:hypothetical protein
MAGYRRRRRVWFADKKQSRTIHAGFEPLLLENTHGYCVPISQFCVIASAAKQSLCSTHSTSWHEIASLRSQRRLAKQRDVA